MKILAIMGSPRKGKGFEIVKQVESQLKKRGDCDFEYIFLKDLDLKICRGCHNCIFLGEDKCPLKDDFPNIRGKINTADGVILSSPGYVWNVSALMKNFLDRYAYTLHRPEYFNLKIMLVANGGSGVTGVLKAMGFTLGGSSIVSKIGIMSPPFKPTPWYQSKIDKTIMQATEKFHKTIQKKDIPRPTTWTFVYFRMFKWMSETGKNILKADYEYFKDKKYFYATKINPIKYAVAGIIVKLFGKYMKKRFVWE
jgi:multimeric flavodoxin WrbA